MNKNQTDKQEEKLVKLLSSLKSEAVFPDGFEDRFLQDLHRKNAIGTTKRPTYFSAMWESFKTFLVNYSTPKFVCSTAGIATMLTIAVLALTNTNPAGSGIVSKDPGASMVDVEAKPGVAIADPVQKEKDSDSKQEQADKK